MVCAVVTSGRHGRSSFMRRVLGLALVVVAACGPVTTGGPAGKPSSSSSANPTAGTHSPSVGFACSLPLADFEHPVGDYATGTLQAGFVTFPGASFALDPNGAFAGPAANGLVKSVAKPYLYGEPRVATFTRRHGRWLPATVAAVSPDSSRYAYAEFYNDASGPRSRIHVVDVVSAADRIVYDQGFYAVIDYETDGIYLFAPAIADAPNRGLWRLDPQARSLKEILPENPSVDFVGSGAAWYGDLAPGDQPPASLKDNPMAQAFFKDRVIRRDLKSGAATPWFRRPGQEVRVIGVDGAGHPVVIVGAPTDAGTSTSQELWLATAPNQAKQIYAGPGSVSADFVAFGSPLADIHGLWFGSDKGIYLYTPDGTFQKVSAAVGEVAGRCS
jgi:hypothetical protein